MESGDISSLTGAGADVHGILYCDGNKFYNNLNSDQSYLNKYNANLELEKRNFDFQTNIDGLSGSKTALRDVNSLDFNEMQKPHFSDEDYVPIKTPDSFKNDSDSVNKSLSDEFLESGDNSKHSVSNRSYFPNSSLESLDMIESPQSLMHHSTWPVERGISSWANTNHAQSFDFQKGYQSQQCNKSLPVHLYSSMESPEMFGSKVKCVYSLLSMLGSQNSIDMSSEFLEMSKNLECCVAMRQSGCIPLLVQLVHSDPDASTKQKAALALYNVIRANPDDRSGRREAKVFKLLQQIRVFCDLLRLQISENEMNKMDFNAQNSQDIHPTSVIGVLTKISFDEEHRHAMCDLGALRAIADIITLDHAAHGNITMNMSCITIRRYAGMALTNLTFGDGKNKSLLCSFKDFLMALVAQLYSENDELMQASASVLRNMSWRADASSKQILRDVGAVLGLTHAAMKSKKETTLKSILSALWNLSAHCSLNKVDICSVEGALGFLVEMLKYKAPSKTLAIVENAGGILRNVSSHIALREDYREILRHHNCLTILLQQLKSPSLIIVSNACGTLWNLSARNSTDQQFLWENGAVPLLRSLIYSKHKMISMGSSAALKNLLNAKPECINFLSDSSSKGVPNLTTLGVRKQKSLHELIDQNLSETCDNIDSVAANSNGYSLQIPCNRENRKVINRNFLSHSSSNSLLQKASKFDTLNRSESKDSITSAQSDSVYERALRRYLVTIPDYHNEIYNSSAPKINSTSLNDENIKKKEGFMSFNEYSKKLQNESKISFYNVPIRSNYSEADCMEIAQDQPIDYSRKYCEQKIGNNDIVETVSTTRNMNEESFGDYQETDLDQPTDYSLKYGENASDSITDLPKEATTKQYYEAQDADFVHEDTVKCYYTEGTPYETTPYNFSTTTSMTDVRMLPQAESNKSNDEKVEEICDKVRDNMTISDEKDTCSDYNDAAVEQNMLTMKTEDYTSKFSSGIGSPEKPVNYCEEGTPGYFSRVSSLSSLDGFNGSSLKNVDTLNEVQENKSPNVSRDKGTSSAKAVSFVQGPDYAQETPLMFSRSSSLGSLSSTEHPEIIDDHNSIVSDFSRLTSGVVSPSELPDSPTQTIPPTQLAKPNHKVVIPEGDIDKDHVTTYAEEGTPAHFSCVTSLSALTIDDDEEEHIYKNKSSNNSTGNEHQLVSEGDDEDDDILAACINIGMQKPRIAMPVHSTPKYEPKVNNDTVRHYCTEGTPQTVSKAPSNSDLSFNDMQSFESADEITVRKGIKQGNDAMDDILSDSSNSSNENKDLLGECIQFGMHKVNRKNRKPDQTSPPTNLKQSDNASNYLIPKDELALYAVEDTPYNFSVCSSISDLTINSLDKPKSEIGQISDSDDILKKNISHEPSPQKDFSVTSALAEKANLLQRMQRTNEELLANDLPVNNLHSFSSSSVESFDSPDGEGNLFEQCIKSGLPKQKSSSSNTKRTSARTLNKTFRDHAGTSKEKIRSQYREKKSMSHIPTFTNFMKEDQDGKISQEEVDGLDLFKECIYSGMPKNRTDNVVPDYEETHVADRVNKSSDKVNDIHSVNEQMTHERHDIDTANKQIENEKQIGTSFIVQPKSEEFDCDKTFTSSDQFGQKLEMKVQHDVERSVTNNGSEDTCSYDMSFPSISCTIPNVVNLDQDSEDVSLCISTTLNESEINQEKNENNSLMKSDEKYSPFKHHNFNKVMSNSSIIEYEATKLAKALESNDSMQYSMLDQIKPPSPMGSLLSLSQSICSNVELDFESNTASTHKVMRNPLPGALLVRRALNSYFSNNSDSFDQNLNNSLYNIDSVKPPSVMNDLDMDNSINSVASITSEIADIKFSNSPPLQHSFLMNSVNDIEDINPPSLLGEMTLNDNSLSGISEAKDITVTLDNNLYLDTPPSTRKSLTPKQNRQLAKERYLTYTLQQDLLNSDKTLNASGQEEENTSNETLNVTVSSPSKLKLKKTCKQRRQEDRARFQTQVLDISECETPESKSPPVDTNTFVKKSIREKRLSDGDRFKTRNLEAQLAEIASSNTNIDEVNEFDFNLEDILAHETDLVLGRLSDETQKSSTNNCGYLNSTLNDSKQLSSPPAFIVESSQIAILENTVVLNKTANNIEDSNQILDQSKSYVINNDEENQSSKVSPVHAAGPEIVKPSQKVHDETVTKVVRPRHSKSPYISPYRNMSSRQTSRNSINKPKSLATKQVDSKTVLNSMLTMKPTLSRFTKSKLDNRKNSPGRNLASKNNFNITVNKTVKTESEVKTFAKPLERQGTFTKEEPNKINQAPCETHETPKHLSPAKRASGIPCKLPKSIELKGLQPSNLRKPAIKSCLQKITSVETPNNKPKIPVKTGIPSREGNKLMPSNIKPPSNLKPPSSKLSFIYKKSEEAKKLTKGETDPAGRKRIQRSQTFDNRATDKCVLAHAAKQKSSIGIRPPQRYGKI